MYEKRRVVRSNHALGVAAATIMLSLCAGCAPGPERVYHQLGPGVKFDSTARTWDWLPSAINVDSPGRFQAPQIRALFLELVEQDLSERGYVRSNNNPAFVLDYTVSRRIVGNPWDPARDRQIVLVTIDVINPANGLLMWRGSAEGEADPSMSVAHLRELLTNTVAAILKPIPKRGSGPGGTEAIVRDRSRWPNLEALGSMGVPPARNRGIARPASL